VTVIVLLVVAILGGGGFAVHKYEPSWLSLHFTSTNANATSQTQPTLPPTTAVPMVVSGATVSNTTDVTVRAASYTIVVTAFGKAWVQATVPPEPKPEFAAIMEAGQTQTLQPGNGQLDLNVGASGVTVQVQVNGQPVTGWNYKPTNVPYTLDFQSTAQS
jgi:hypothetical protein